jgi:hypothetical protein
MKTMLLILVALFASCAVLTAQDARQGDSSPAKSSDQHGQQQAQKPAEKPASTPKFEDATPASSTASASSRSGSPSLLKDTGPASVEDAARKAAHDLAAAGQSGSSAKGADPTKDASGSSTPSEIGEFHAVPEGTSRSSANPVVQKDKSLGKRIHGELYGAGGPDGRAGGGSTSVTSKSGKTSVYVQSDQATSTAAPPQ